MKKYLIFVFAAVLAACGGNASHSDVSAEAEAARNGLLGSDGEAIVLKFAEFDERNEQLYAERQKLDQEIEEFMDAHKGASQKESEKLRQEMNEKFNPRMEELIKKKRALEEEEMAWKKSMTDRLKGVHVPTELVDGSTLKLVEPFTVTYFDDNLAHLSTTVELTVDRPHLLGSKGYNTNKVHPIVSAIDAEGNSIGELSAFESRFDVLGADLKKGDQIKLTYRLSFELLAAKKLLIDWDQAPDAGQAVASAGTKSELGLFQLRGPVKECVWNDGSETRNLGFDQNGMWTSLNGETPWGDGMKVKRDASNRIVKRGDAYDEEYTTYKYNDEGQLVESMEKLMDGGFTTRYTYNADGDCTDAVVSDAEGDVKITYTILARDAHNNWTKRKNQNGTIETRTIRYY